jgi:putative NADH-flavin reductase
MKIAIIGATGNAGRALMTEGYSRQHDMTAIVRSKTKAFETFGPKVAVLEKDAFALTRADLIQFDAIVVAAAFPNDTQNYVKLADHLTKALTNEPTLILFILGSSSLITSDGQTINQKLVGKENTAPWIPIAIAQGQELNFLRAVTNVNWIGFSPQQAFQPGPPTHFLLGHDAIMTDQQGQSTLSTGNAAKAILDELETPQHIKSRFTAVNH